MGKEYNLRGNTVVADHFRSLDGNVLDAQGVEDAIKNKTEVAALVSLTDNSGGSADNTIAAIPSETAVTVTTAGGNTYADTAINTALASVNTNINAVGTAVKNDIADLTAKVNAIIAALKA
jgi:hypothetical protein